MIEPTELPRPRPGGRNRRGESRPRTSSATSRASSSTSQWSRKNPASSSSSTSRSSCSRRAWASTRVDACTAVVAIVEHAVTDPGELRDRGLLRVGEVGVAVAELLRQVEREPFGERDGSLGGGAVERVEAARPSPPVRAARSRDCRAVPVRSPPARCCSGSRRARPATRRDGGRGRARSRSRRSRHRGARRDREAGRCGGVATLVRPLELDEEPVATERPGETGGGVRVAMPETVARAAGEADKTLVVLRDGLERDARWRGRDVSRPYQRLRIRVACLRARR